MKPSFFARAVVLFFLPLITLAFSQKLLAQPPALPDTSKMKYNQISAAMGLYVFPAKKQSQQKQKEDEFECYKWAVDQSGIDPLNLPKVEAQAVETGPDGTVVVTAAKGTAAGLAIGAIAGDAGKGAAIGAVVGGLGGIRKKKAADAQKKQQANANAQGQEQAIVESYLKAFSVCMEGKGYTIK